MRISHATGRAQGPSVWCTQGPTMSGKQSWWNSKVVRKSAKVSGEVAKFAMHLTSSTTTLGKAGVLLGVANAVLGPPPSLAAEFVEHRVIVLPDGLNKTVFKTLATHGHLQALRESDRENEFVLSEGDLHIFWVTAKASDRIQGPWYAGGTDAEAKTLIGRSLWESLGPRVALRILNWGHDVELLPDPLKDHASSKKAQEIHDSVSKHNAKGYNRSLLFHGPSGTGKSFIMRHVAALRGGFSLRHKADQNTPFALGGAVAILQPKTLLLDDVDRDDTSKILDTVEIMKKECPLIMMSANFTKLLDPALQRPGRFDERHHIEALDDEVVAHLLHNVPPEVVARVRKLPVSYIEEFRISCEVLGTSEATLRLDELEALAESLAESEPPQSKDPRRTG